jgi:hypothetical protein
MLTWDATKEWLRERFHVVADAPGFVQLAFHVEGAYGAAPHAQHIELGERMGEPALYLFCQVMSQDHLAAAEALGVNLGLTLGALALCRGWYVLRHVLPIAGLSVERLRADLELLLCEAEALRRVHSTPFLGYQE